MPKLTRKQAKFVEEYVQTGNGTQAALKAYEIESDNNDNVASSIATENLRKPDVAQAIEIKQKTMREAFGDEGVTTVKIAKKVAEFLEAKRMTLFGQVPDYKTQLEGAKIAANVYGIQDQQPQFQANTNSYTFIFSGDTQEKIKAIEAEIKAKLLNKNVQSPTQTLEAN